MTKEELLLSAGVGDLQDTVANRRRRFITGHRSIAPPHVKNSQPSDTLDCTTAEGGSRRWGRPKRTWRDTFIEDMREMGVSGSGTRGKVRSVASDRARRRQLVAQCFTGTR